MKVTAKGLWSGLHQSPFHGFSVEFSEYRQYSPGDDLRYLDWKALARTDRMYLKKNEDETNLRCLVLLDVSRSMSFSSGQHPKLEYARTIAATFAYFMLQQRDMAGLATFDDILRSYVEPRWRSGQFRRILAAIPEAATGTATNLPDALAETARLCRQRSMILLVSDLLDAPDSWIPALRELKAQGHHLRVAQILDPAELSLDFGQASHWEDLETAEHRHIDPERERPAYRERIAEHQASLEQALQTLGVPMRTLTTDTPMDRALLDLIRARSASARMPEEGSAAR